MMRWFLIGLLAVLPALAQAQTPGGNMPPDFYPRPTCVKPDKTGLNSAPGVQNQDAMRTYNYKVKRFNENAAAFNACIKLYVDKAQNDINTIQAIVHAAVADANAP
jgi:hypothetical protein